MVTAYRPVCQCINDICIAVIITVANAIAVLIVIYIIVQIP